MPKSITDAVVRAIDGVIDEVDRANRLGGTFGAGSPMRPQLERLRADMQGLREDTLAGKPPARNNVLAILRWVIDWVPDPEGELVRAVARIDDALAS